jgi:hypothetical protein
MCWVQILAPLFFFFFVELELALRTSCLQSRHPTTWATPPVPSSTSYHQGGVRQAAGSSCTSISSSIAWGGISSHQSCCEDEQVIMWEILRGTPSLYSAPVLAVGMHGLPCHRANPTSTRTCSMYKHSAHATRHTVNTTHICDSCNMQHTPHTWRSHERCHTWYLCTLPFHPTLKPNSCSHIPMRPIALSHQCHCGIMHCHHKAV